MEGWALVSPDGVAPSRMVSVSASVNLPLHHEVQRSSLLAPAHLGGPRKRAVKRLWLCCGVVRNEFVDMRHVPRVLYAHCSGKSGYT